jgi:hypothetical protein
MVKKPPTLCEIYKRNHLGIIEGSFVATHVTFKIYKNNLGGYETNFIQAHMGIILGTYRLYFNPNQQNASLY